MHCRHVCLPNVSNISITGACQQHHQTRDSARDVNLDKELTSTLEVCDKLDGSMETTAFHSFDWS